MHTPKDNLSIVDFQRLEETVIFLEQSDHSTNEVTKSSLPLTGRLSLCLSD